MEKFIEEMLELGAMIDRAGSKEESSAREKEAIELYNRHMSKDKMVFTPVKLTDRKPDFSKRIFFYNSKTEGGFMLEYMPNEEIEYKKGKLKELKDIPQMENIIMSSYTHWLEPTKI